MAMLVLLLAAFAMLALYAPPRPQPVRVRRNPLQEDLLASYANRRD
jgi:hypothetical protein